MLTVTLRMLPMVLVIGAAIGYVFHVEGADGYAWRNALPMLIVLALAAATLRLGHGDWRGAGWKWPLGTAGFAIPAVGLSVYLHYGYATDMNGMVSDAMFPEQLFRFLPLYTVVAGAIGFAIGWIVGRNL